MISKQLRNITARELIKALERDGFRNTTTSGSHRIYRNVEHRRVTVSYHHSGQTFPLDILKGMIKDAGWTVEDLKSLKLIK